MYPRMDAGAWLDRSGIVQSRLMANGIILSWSPKRAKTVVSAGAAKSRMDQAATLILCQMMVLSIFQITHSAIQMK